MRLIWWLATVVAVSLVSIFLSERHALDPAHNLTLTISAPIEDVFHDAASPLNDIYDGIADRGDLVRENEDLRAQLEELQTQLAAQQDAEQHIAELKDVLEIRQTHPEEQYLAANVIAQEPSGLKRMIAIDRGLDDGLDEGMVVLSRNGSLIGTVARAYDKYAWIRLITDPDSAVNAEVHVGATQPSAPSDTSVITGADPSPTPSASQTPALGASEGGSVRGVAEGDLRNELLLDLLPPDADIQPGSLVLTSGLGGNYPPGLLLGIIEEVEQRPQSAFKKATLEPAAQLSSLETVLILINFVPARLDSP